MEENRLKVSDPSQPKKIRLFKIFFAFAGIFVLLFTFGVIPLDKSGVLGSEIGYVAGSHTSKLVTTTVREVMSLSSGAQFRCFGNASGTTPIYLGFGTSTDLVVGTGFPLLVSTTEYFFGDSLFKGSVYGIAAASTSLSMCEL